MYKKQLNECFVNFLSKFQFGFRQELNTQHCLLVIIGKFRKVTYKKGVFAAVLTDSQKPSTASLTNYLSQN